MLEQYVLLGECTDVDLVSRACSLLEGAEVPLLVEHTSRDFGLGPELLYRILVPSELSQTSLAAVAGILSHLESPVRGHAELRA